MAPIVEWRIRALADVGWETAPLRKIDAAIGWTGLEHLWQVVAACAGAAMMDDENEHAEDVEWYKALRAASDAEESRIVAERLAERQALKSNADEGTYDGDD